MTFTRNVRRPPPLIVNQSVSQTWLYKINWIFSTSLTLGLGLITQPLVSLKSPRPPPRLFLLPQTTPPWTWRLYGNSVLKNIKSHLVPIYFSFEVICTEIFDCAFLGYFLYLYRPHWITSPFFVFYDLLENVVTSCL